jgi:hypothetical protein
MLRIPHRLNNRLTDSSKVVSPTHLPQSTPQEYYISPSGIRVCWRLNELQGLVYTRTLVEKLMVAEIVK